MYIVPVPWSIQASMFLLINRQSQRVWDPVIKSIHITVFIIHEIFFLVCDWSKRVALPNIPRQKKWGTSENIPQFSKLLEMRKRFER